MGQEQLTSQSARFACALCRYPSPSWLSAVAFCPRLGVFWYMDSYPVFGEVVFHLCLCALSQELAKGGSWRAACGQHHARHVPAVSGCPA